MTGEDLTTVMDTTGSDIEAAAFKPCRRAGAIGLIFLALAALSGCASNDEELVETTPADVLYNQGLAAMQSGKPTQALKKFEDLDRQHPYSQLAKKSIMLQAYSNFERGAYIDTIQAGKRFVMLYPSDPDAAYAQYLVAESYQRQIPDITRDQAIAKEALDAYTELVTKWPSSEYAKDARVKIEMTRDQLAGKEMEIGRFYLSKARHLAAINRFKTVVSQYQTTRHIEEALARIVESYYALGVVSEAQTAAAVLGHNFPESQWYKDSYTLLKNGGYEPTENRSSWISKAFQGII